MHDQLTRLAILYGTDKFGYHDYTPNYFRLLRHMQDKPIKLLEIGVGGYADADRGGQSLEVWRDFFPNGEVTGIDIQEKTMDLGPRVKILRGSQVDPDFLKELVAQRGPFDVIVDDGSHRNEHVVESYKLLFPSLAPGGVYVAEDVQTSFFPRFGGSLELTAPNSVGYFGDLMARMNEESDDPLIRDVAAIKRFHNMVALYKKPMTVDQASVLSAERLADFQGKGATLAIMGDPGFDLTRLPFAPGSHRHCGWDNPAAAKGADVILCCLRGDATGPDGATVDALLSGLNDGGLLVLHSDQPKGHLSSSSPLMQHAQRRFTQVDHVEMVVHFPKAPIDDLAGQIYSVERHLDGLLYLKAPNRYPSNFGYDINNPQAAAAIAHMAEVLADATTEGGLMAYAGLLAHHDRPEPAREIILRLSDMNPNSREYFQMAGTLAKEEKRLSDAHAIYTAALKEFPLDSQFSVGLAGILANQKHPAEAEAVLRASYDHNPRARAVVAQLARMCSVIGKLDEAIELGRKSINLFPVQARSQRWIILAGFYDKAGRADEANAAREEAARLAEG